MSISAWIFMLTAWGLILGATVYCFGKLLTSERKLDSDDAE